MSGGDRQATLRSSCGLVATGQQGMNLNVNCTMRGEVCKIGKMYRRHTAFGTTLINVRTIS